jgi:ketosteroid isomerase-like protein
MDVKKEIEKGNLRFAELVRKGDAKALSNLYTSDASIMPVGMNTIKGRKGIEDFWGSAIKGMGLKDATLKTIEIIGEGNTVTEMGEYSLKLQSAGKEMEDVGKYAVVWKNTPEGYKLHYDIWTSNLPQK